MIKQRFAIFLSPKRNFYQSHKCAMWEWNWNQMDFFIPSTFFLKPNKQKMKKQKKRGLLCHVCIVFMMAAVKNETLQLQHVKVGCLSSDAIE